MKISNISCCNKSDLGKSYSLATPGRFGVPAALNSLSPIKTTSLSTQTGTPGFKYSEEEIKKGALLIYSLDIPGYSPLAILLSRAMEVCLEPQTRWCLM